MSLIAFKIDCSHHTSMKAISYVKKINEQINNSLVMSGKVSIPFRLIPRAIIFVNVRYWLFNIKLVDYFYAWAFKRNLKKAGYTGVIKRLSGDELSKKLEVLL